MNELGWIVVFHACSWEVDLGYKVCCELIEVSFLKLWSSMNCDVLVLLVMLSCCLLTYDDVYPN